MDLLGLPRGLVLTNGVVLVLFAGWLLPFAAHAFAGPYCVVRSAKFGSLDRNAFVRLAGGA
jgi:hypothetical protein